MLHVREDSAPGSARFEDRSELRIRMIVLLLNLGIHTGGNARPAASLHVANLEKTRAAIHAHLLSFGERDLWSEGLALPGLAACAFMMSVKLCLVEGSQYLP